MILSVQQGATDGNLGGVILPISVHPLKISRLGFVCDFTGEAGPF